MIYILFYVCNVAPEDIFGRLSMRTICDLRFNLGIALYEMYEMCCLSGHSF